jgi:hypothetical protein
MTKLSRKICKTLCLYDRIQGDEGSSEKNETLRQAQGDRREGFKDSRGRVKEQSCKLEPAEGALIEKLLVSRGEYTTLKEG